MQFYNSRTLETSNWSLKKSDDYVESLVRIGSWLSNNRLTGNAQAKTSWAKSYLFGDGVYCVRRLSRTVSTPSRQLGGLSW